MKIEGQPLHRTPVYIEHSAFDRRKAMQELDGQQQKTSLAIGRVVAANDATVEFTD